MRQRGHNSQRFRGRVEHSSQSRAAVFILLFAQRPRFVLHDIFVNRRHQCPRRFQRTRKLELVKQHSKLADGLPRRRGDGIIGASPRSCVRWIRHLALEISSNHGQRATSQITEPVCQVRVVALHQRVEGKRSILPKHNLAQQKIAQRIRTQHVEDGLGAHDVAARLRHLVFFKQQPAVSHNRFRHRQPRGHEKSRPIHAVESNDLFSDHLHIGRPVFLERLLRPRMGRTISDGGDVIRQRIQPHIDNVLGIVGHRDAPRKSRTAD